MDDLKVSFHAVQRFAERKGLRKVTKLKEIKATKWMIADMAQRAKKVHDKENEYIYGTITFVVVNNTVVTVY